MKYKLIIIISFIFLLVGCGMGKDISDYGVLRFNTGKKNIEMNDIFNKNDFGDVIDEYSYDGDDLYHYTFEGYVLVTKKINDVEKINYLYFLDEENKVKTNEGIKIGSSEEDVIKTYGKPKSSSKNGVYEYYLGNTLLQILIKNNKVIYVEYRFID